METLVASPQCFDTGVAIVFAAQEAAQMGDATNEILHREGTFAMLGHPTHKMEFLRGRHLFGWFVRFRVQHGPQLAPLFDIAKESDGPVTQAMREVYAENAKELARLEAVWRHLVAAEIAQQNDLARELQFSTLVTPPTGDPKR